MIVAVICTGQSLTQADVDYCRGRAKVVAVSDAIKLAPWADAMVSHDAAWWRAHPEVDYSGPKWTAHPQGVSELGVNEFRPSGGNSGTLGILVAQKMGATKIVLLGADGKGTHYFGKHTGPKLKNTTPLQFSMMHKQFAKLSKLPVVNCTPGSVLTCFPKMELRQCLPLGSG